MARNLGNTIQNKFGGGLITEATGLNFPPNGATATSNCIFNEKMSVTRRPGFNFELNSVPAVFNTTNRVIVEYLWQGVAGNGTINFQVVQIGRKVLFYNVDPTQPLSAGLFSNELDLTSYNTAGSPAPDTQYCQFASGYGYLFIVHPYCDPIYVQYSITSGALTFTQVTLMQRDFAGLIEPGVLLQNRPLALTTAHTYNLFNQGWIYYSTPWDTYINDFQSELSAYPSNCDVWWFYKDSSGDFDPATTKNNVSVGNTQAPQGSILFPCFNQDRSAAIASLSVGLNYHGPDSVLPGIPVVSAGFNRPSAVAFFAGRVFYAGVGSQQFTNQIYYSQIIQGNQNINQCYQANDPTGDDNAVTDLLPSDGGVLIEPEIGQIYKMYTVAYSLIIFASNGIWAISGNTGSGFTATDFSVSKISSIGMQSPTSFIDFDGIPIWWNNDGIFTMGSGGVSPNGNQGAAIQSLTEGTIKTFYNAIPAASKLNAKGTYNRSNHTITWLYTSTVPTTIDSQYIYDSALLMNTITKAFYLWSLPTTPQTISGITTIQTQGTGYILENVINRLGANVVDQLGNIIQVARGIPSGVSAITKYLTQFNVSPGVNAISWSDNSDLSYLDFGSIDYLSTTTGGYSLDGQAIAKFQAPYVQFYLNNTNSNQVQVTVSWNFANDPSTTKISVSDILMSEGGRYDYVTYRRKFRGSGRAMQVTFSSITGQPFEVAGWAIEVSTNTNA